MNSLFSYELIYFYRDKMKKHLLLFVLKIVVGIFSAFKIKKCYIIVLLYTASSVAFRILR